MLREAFGKSMKDRGRELHEDSKHIGKGMEAHKLTDMELCEDD